MPLGMANRRGRADGRRHAGRGCTPIMFDGIGIWNNHPIALAVGTAWIQVGIGVLLLVSNASVGRVAAPSQWAGPQRSGSSATAPAAYSRVSNSILFGWPGASLFYVVVGVWLALPPSNFLSGSRATRCAGSACCRYGRTVAVPAFTWTSGTAATTTR